MAPQIPSLAQSESKAKFFQRLGLQVGSSTDKRLYAEMKLEAAEGRKRLIEEHQLATISETAMHGEILRIYRQASPQTRAVYDLGHDISIEEENWIIRWLLWHAFRYRDQRNNRSRNRAASQASNSGDDDELQAATPTRAPIPPMGSSNVVEQSEPREDASSRGSRFWDPVRNQWQDA